MKTVIFVTSLLALAALFFAGWKTSRFGYETAEYKILEKEGPFEIREYPALTLASTPMEGADSSDGSFMRLFRYISRENETGEKIAMTTPVFTTGGETSGEMSFVVPREVAGKGTPKPSSGQVTVKGMEGGKVVAYRYSGGWDSKTVENATKKLEEFVNSRRLTTQGDYFRAGYDPPFTPRGLRRNEVLLRLSE